MTGAMTGVRRGRGPMSVPTMPMTLRHGWSGRPVFHYWISEQLGREPRDVATPDTWWERWSGRTRLVLPRGFVLAGRDAAVAQIRGALGKPTRPITVAAASGEEALAVICASLIGDGSDGDDVDDLRARALVVSRAGAWDRLDRCRAWPGARRRLR